MFQVLTDSSARGIAPRGAVTWLRSLLIDSRGRRTVFRVLSATPAAPQWWRRPDARQRVKNVARGDNQSAQYGVTALRIRSVVAARLNQARHDEPSGRLPGGQAGTTTAEYAIGTLAACAFAAVLYKIVTSASVAALLSGIIHRALGSAG